MAPPFSFPFLCAIHDLAGATRTEEAKACTRARNFKVAPDRNGESGTRPGYMYLYTPCSRWKLSHREGGLAVWMLGCVPVTTYIGAQSASHGIAGAGTVGLNSPSEIQPDRGMSRYLPR